MAITRYGVKSHLSLAVVHGNTAYLSGHIARGGTTVAEQTTDILEQIDEQLAEVGGDGERGTPRAALCAATRSLPMATTLSRPHSQPNAIPLA